MRAATLHEDLQEGEYAHAMYLAENVAHVDRLLNVSNFAATEWLNAFEAMWDAFCLKTFTRFWCYGFLGEAQHFHCNLCGVRFDDSLWEKNTARYHVFVNCEAILQTLNWLILNVLRPHDHELSERAAAAVCKVEYRT